MNFHNNHYDIGIKIALILYKQFYKFAGFH